MVRVLALVLATGWLLGCSDELACNDILFSLMVVHVVDANGQCVSDVEVTVPGANANPPSSPCDWSFYGDPGTYTVVVSRNGQELVSTTVTVSTYGECHYIRTEHVTLTVPP